MPGGDSLALPEIGEIEVKEVRLFVFVEEPDRSGSKLTEIAGGRTVEPADQGAYGIDGASF
jgi:hypothetical protein